jgi:hypothetical protein
MAGLGFQTSSVRTPGLTYGAAGFVERDLSSGRSARAWTGFESGTGRRDGTDVAVDWMGGGLQGCPMGIRVHAVVAAPCAAIEGGALRSEGLPGGTIVRGRSEWNGWFAGALLGRTAVALGVLTVDAAFGVVLPITRVRFLISSPDSQWYQTPAVGWSFSVGVGATLP